MNDVATVTALRHWRAAEDEGSVILTLDVADASANALSRAVLQELEAVLGELARRSCRGLIIRSGKASGFIVGADVREFEKIDNADAAAALARSGQQVLDRIANLPFPSVAVIHGNCLGGGMELTLACTYRVMRDDPGTRMGLPEVKLGIHPGFAGTVRLPPLVGDLVALNLMLTGRTVSGREAKRIGLVEEIVPERHLMRAAHALLKRAAPRHRAPWWKQVPRAAIVRRPVRRLVERSVRAKANPDHYPAPYRILDLWERDANQQEEARSLGDFLVSRTSRSLVRVFLLGEALKRTGKRVPHDIRRVHVVGAGVMGADIAIWSALRGFQVTLQDQNAEALGRAVKKAADFYKKKLKAPIAVQEALDRLMPDLDGYGLKRADLVIEAIVEKVDAKQALFEKIEKAVKPQCLLATNTSSIPLETIGVALRDPSRLVGLHFFNPVAQMQLVEIVRGRSSSPDALARARAFTGAIDRLPLDVRSSPGFLVNRVLMPYLLEAVTIAGEGVALEEIDRAATDFGMPMGPILLADTVGLDICLSVAEMLSGPLKIDVPPKLREMVQNGKLGRKSGEGFYFWNKKGKAQVPKWHGEPDTPITERLILRMLNEAVACLREGVVNGADSVDAGMVYGTGFAPFLGGPMRYAATLGETGIQASLERMARENGARFAPDTGWGKGLIVRNDLTSG